MLLFVTVAVVVIAAVVSFYSIINIVAVVYSVVLAALSLPLSHSLSTFTGTNGKLVANSVFFILIVDRSERVPSTQVTQVRVKRVPLCYFYFIAFFN